MFKTTLLTASAALLIQLAGAPAIAGPKDCSYRGPKFVDNYLQCVKQQEPRYAQKGKGYTTMGNNHEFGRGGPRHYGQAAMYYKLACDHADGDGCMYLARLYQRGLGVPKNKGRAARLLKRAFSLQ
jgi:TPR repeat protein